MSRSQGRRPVCEALEPRILYSADLTPFTAGLVTAAGPVMPVTLQAAAIPAAQVQQIGAGQSSLATTAELQARDPSTPTEPSAAALTAAPAVIELAVIDTAIGGADQLIADIERQQADGRSILVVRIDAGDDGIAAVTQVLSELQAVALAGTPNAQVSAIHLIGHGDAQGTTLGDSRLDLAALRLRSAEIAQWSSALTADADLLLYGCDIAAGASGQSLAQGLAALTGADVAASEDLTGATQRGGDWELEYRTGSIEQTVAISESTQLDWDSVLATYVVTNTNDSGAGSLRAAITSANGNGGPDTINFNIAGAGVHTINLLSALPDITGQLNIDGSSQPGYADSPLIQLDGTLAPANTDGIRLGTGSSGSVVRGLIFSNLGENGIDIQPDSSNNTLAGNWIGLDATGSAIAGSGSDGIEVSGSLNIIGGTQARDRNVIAGSAGNGIRITGSTATGNQVYGNYIGTDITGLIDLGNIDDGIEISSSASGNLIGGSTDARRNVISGNNDDGVQINNLTQGNIVENNYIGVGADGRTALGNAMDGVEIYGGSYENRIGGLARTEANQISSNGGRGIYLSSADSADNALLVNLIFNNAGTGIELVPLGVTANDAGDADVGANDLQNFPVLTTATVGATGTSVGFSLNSRPNASYRLDFYSSRPNLADPTNGEGSVYLGYVALTTDGSGNASGAALLDRWVNGGDRITATATEIIAPGQFGSTSEFAANITAVGASNIIVVDSTSDLANGNVTSISALQAARGADGVISLREAMTAANNTGGADSIYFAIPGIGTQYITPGSALPILVGGVRIDGYTQADAAVNTLNLGSDARLRVVINGTSAGAGSAGLNFDINSDNSTVRGLVIQNFDDAGINAGGSAGDKVDNLVIVGNFIGTDYTGTQVTTTGNKADGIGLYDTSNATVGSALVADRNIIAGNGTLIGYQGGINVGYGTSGITITNNLIGVAADGLTVLGNAQYGVMIDQGATNIIIGHDAVDRSNRIAGSATGVEVANNGAFNTSGVQIFNNAIWNNTGLSIDLGANGWDGVTANDLGDPDTGPNALQNFPVITAAYTNNLGPGRGVVYVNGTFSGAANTWYMLSFYADTSADPSGHGEAHYPLGSGWFLTNGAGNLNWAATAHIGSSHPFLPAGSLISATATNTVTGNTSELSTNFAALLGDMTVTNNSDIVNGDVTSPAGLIGNNGGDGISLREALLAMNSSVLVGYTPAIRFNIGGGGQHIIQPTSALPVLTRAVTIDGESQPGFSGTPLIRVDGALAGAGGVNGIESNSWMFITGLSITGFSGDGVRFNGDWSTVANSYIGVALDGSAAGNAGYGIQSFANNTHVGGAYGLSVISDNDAGGVRFNGVAISSGWVNSSRIGTNAGGTAALGSQQYGIVIDGGANNIQIGSLTAQNRNVISGNQRDGIKIDGENSDDIVILGNLIGLNATATATLGNGEDGINIVNGADRSIIGGTATGAGNEIGGSGRRGIEIWGASSDTVIEGNSVGTNSAGVLDLGNSWEGIFLSNAAASNRIGGTTSAQANRLAFNGLDGVRVASTAGSLNTLSGNQIYSNTGLGIDLQVGAESSVVTANDAGDADSGANSLQNYPTLRTSVTDGATQVTVNGVLDSAPNSYYRIEFFASTTQDATGHGEGQRYLGYLNLPTDSQGHAVIATTLSANVASTEFIAATATRTDASFATLFETSEFSGTMLASSGPNTAPTFDAGGSGFTTTSVGPDFSVGHELLVQPDGRYLVLGSSNDGSLNDFAVARYNADGSPDNSFSGDGQLVLALSVGMDDGYSGALQSDGKILIAGYTAMGANLDFGIVRLNPDGSLDTSFSTDGIATIDLLGDDDEAHHVLVQPDGKIVLAGTAYNGSNYDFGVVRLNADGTPDLSFGSAGKLTATWGMGADIAYDAILQSDGKIVVAGYCDVVGGTDFAVLRLNADGTQDFSFSGDGMQTIDFSSGLEIAYSVAVQDDGKLLLAGETFNGSDFDLAVVRLDASGLLDPTFSGDGKATFDIGGMGDAVHEIALQPDGAIVLAGKTGANPAEDLLLVRLTAAGLLDTSFSTDGVVTTSVSSGQDFANGLVVQSNGLIAVAGYGQPVSQVNMALARYTSAGEPDTTFNAPSSLDATPNYVRNGPSVLLDLNAVVSDVELDALDSYAGATLTLARQGGANADDVLSFDGVVVTTSGGDVFVGGVQIGTYMFAVGQLNVSLGANSTAARVDSLLQHIGYSNLSASPPPNVTLDWTFSDGNTGSQGSGGALTAVGSIVVSISSPPGVTVGAISGPTTEAGGTATFNVTLDTAPTQNVTIGLTTSDSTEGIVGLALLTFTPANWNVAQTVTVTGVDDTVDDGNASLLIVTSNVSSADLDYNGMNVDDVLVTNNDDDTSNQILVDTTLDVLDGTVTSLTSLWDNRGADGRISLREAITAANNTVNGNSPDLIGFAIPLSDVNYNAGRGVFVLSPTSTLPSLTDSVSIDGTTQGNFIGQTNPGEMGTGGLVGVDGLMLSQVSRPEIELFDGGGTVADGLIVSAGNVTIRGLAMFGFDSTTININGGNNLLIEGNVIGSAADSFSDPGAGNRSGFGLHAVNAIGVTVRNNLIGYTTVGGGLAATTGTSGWLIENNEFRSNGLTTQFNDAISLVGDSSANDVRGNLIADSNAVGIDVGGSSTGNVLINNTISGNGQQGTEPYGILLQNTSQNNEIRRNIITGNLGDGVGIAGSSTGNAVFENSILGNGGQSIDLGLDGVTGNDPGDIDAGPNDLQNYPVLTSARQVGADTQVQGTLNALANTDYRIDFYSSPTGDVSGYGEAQTFRYTLPVTTDATGLASLNTTFVGIAVPIGHVLTATATLDLGASVYRSTSEMAANVVVAPDNVAPVIAFGEGDRSYVENAGPIILDSLATVSDAGQTDFGAGHLIVDITANAAAGDDLAIQDQGMGAGQVGVTGSSVYYGGTLIGGFVATGTTLDVTFNTSADLAAVQAVMRQVGYRSVVEDPLTLPRTVRFVLDDGDGGISAAITKQILVAADNDLWVTTTSDLADGDTASIDALQANRGADNRISLREALLATNNTANAGTPDRIYFNIADALVGGAHTIAPAAGLPSISDPVVLDASTEPDFLANGSRPVVVIDGNNLAVDGLRLMATADGSTIRGLLVRDFGGDAIQIDSGADGNAIVGNYLGDLSPSGTVSGASEVNTGHGVNNAGANNTIGGSGADRNVISGNGMAGIMLAVSAANTLVQGNYIGLDASGLVVLGNSGYGIDIQAGSHQIGGTAAWAGNVIGANAGGVRIATSSNTLQGNIIGLSADQSVARGNSGDGILIAAGGGNQIGGTAAGAANTIAGNAGVGIVISDGAANRVEGNRIGTNQANAVLGNQSGGVRIDGTASGTVVGGTTAGAGNRIANNPGSGIQVLAGQHALLGNLISGTSIGSGAGLAIDLDAPGVTANDPGDVDTGPNNLQNMPTITLAMVSGSDLIIQGQLSSAVSTTYRLEFFATGSPADPSGHGEAASFMGALTVTTDGSGAANFNSTLVGAGVLVGEFVTATATVDLGLGSFTDTSELTANLAAVQFNTAPVLADTALTMVQPEDSGLPVGAVGVLVGSLTGGISDADGGALRGLAIVDNDESAGVWYYTIDGGSNWRPMERTLPTAALLLADDPNTRLYFASNLDVNGTMANALTVRAWDQTSGSAGSRVDTSSNGGNSAFSGATDVIDVTINAQNDAPTLTGAELIVNGDFTTDLSAWTTAGQVDGPGLFARFGVADVTGVNSISQTVNTVPGQTYEIRFDYADAASNRNQSLQVSATGSTNLLTTGNIVTSTFGGNWVPYRFAFTADSATTQILFTDTSDSAGLTIAGTFSADGLLTHVSVRPANGGLGAAAFTEGGAAALLDADVGVADVELTALGNFSSANLRLMRQGGANVDDQFAGSGTLAPLLEGGSLVVDATTIGSVVTNSAGTLLLQFNANASSALVESAMRQIVYANTSDAPPASLQIAWTLNDGNAGAQGAGGALAVAGASTVNITAVNDPPVITAASLTVSEGQITTLGAANFSIADPDSASFTYTVSLISGGYFQLSSAPGTPVTSFTSAQLSGGLVQFVDDGDEAPPGFDVQVSDGAAFSNVFTPAVTFVPGNDAPVLNSASLALAEGQVVTLQPADLNYADPDNASHVFNLTAVTGGFFELSGAPGVPITSFNTAELAGGQVRFVDDGNETAPSFNLTVNDGVANSSTVAAGIGYTPVNDAPVLTAATLTVNEGATVTLTPAGFAITDPDNVAFSYTVSGLSGGQFELVSAPGTPILNFSSAQLAAGQVRFVDDGDEIGPSFDVTVNDGAASSNLLSATVTYASVNDAPGLLLPPTQALPEDGALGFASAAGNAIVLSDVDAGAGQLQLTLGVGQGRLTLGSVSGLAFVTGTGSNESTMSFRGTLANLQSALEGLTYVPNADFVAVDALQVQFSDLGNAGLPGPQSASGSVPLAVGAINDAPGLSLPGVQATLEDSPLTLSAANGNAIVLADVDAAGNAVELRLAVTDATLTLASLQNLSFIQGTGVDDTELVVRGTVASLNAALEGLVLTPAADFNGVLRLSVVVDDLGNLGAGASQSASGIVDVQVAAVNDPPSELFRTPAVVMVETAPVGTSAGDIVAFDVDDSSGFVFTLLAGGENFSIDALTGAVTVAGRSLPDYLVQSSFQITVRAEDAAGASIERAFTIQSVRREVIPPPAAPREVGQVVVPSTGLSNVSERVAIVSSGDDAEARARQSMLAEGPGTNDRRRIAIMAGGLKSSETAASAAAARRNAAEEARRTELEDIESTTRVDDQRLRRSFDVRRLFDLLSFERLRQSQMPSNDMAGPLHDGRVPIGDFEWAPEPRQSQTFHVIVEAAQIGGLAVSAGLVFYALRAGSLVAAMLTALPAWSSFDPLVVLAKNRREQRNEWGDDMATEMAEDEAGVRGVIGAESHFSSTQEHTSSLR